MGWKRSLPTSFLIDSSRGNSKTHVASILALHMHYHEVIILLHRPFIIPLSVDSTSPLTPVASALEACTSSATEICRLLKIYRQQFGLRQIYVYSIHTLMTASLTHIYDVCRSTSPGGNEVQKLALTSIQILSELAETFNSSRRALEVATSLWRDWQHEMSRSLKRKRYVIETSPTPNRPAPGLT